MNIATANNYAETTAKEGWTRGNAIQVRAKAWSGYPVGRVFAHVAPNGDVHVYDSVACHWTTCHCLSETAKEKIRSIAAI